MSTLTTGSQAGSRVEPIPFIFDVNGLYILLSDRGEASWTFHWGLYLHQAPNSGVIYHLINEGTSTTWRFDSRPSQSVMYSKSLLAALKVAVLDPGLHQAFLNRLEQIPIADSARYREKITCRVWLKEALYALDDEGYIKLTQSVEDIEEEANDLAMISKSSGTRKIALSVGSQA